MPDPLGTLRRLHALDANGRAERWREGAEAWRALGNPERALAWARLGPGPLEDWERAWSGERASQQGTLARNAAAAAARPHPPALPSLAWDEAGDLAAGVTWIRRDGRVDLVQESEGTLDVLPLAAPDPVISAVRQMAATGHPVLLGSLGNADLPRLALNAQPEIFLTMRPALYLVEPSLGVFRMLARLFDLSDVLAADQALWFVGPDWPRRLEGFLRAHPGIPLPAARAILGSRLDTERLQGVLDAGSAWRAAETARLEAAARAAAEARPEASWREALAPGGRPRILLVTSRFTTVLQYAIRDLEQAFRALGCETAVVIEDRDCAWSVAIPLRQRVLSFRPDLVVQIDHLRPEFGEAVPAPIPYACWIQDRLPNLFDSRYVGKLGARDLTFSMWPAMTADCLKAGYPEVFPLPVAGNSFVYRPPEKPLPPGPDVAFVSNIAVPQAVPAYPGLLEEADRILRAEGIGYRDEGFYNALLDRLASALGLRVASADRPSLVRLLSFDVERFVQRTEPLRWARAMGLDVAVWGRGWERSPEFAPLARGIVQPGTPLRDLYASARIHLHMNSDTNMHARVFECLLSGGCLLAWAHPGDAEPGGLGEALAIGREVATFSGRTDFEAQVRRLLADPAAREALSRAGRERTLAAHTTLHRATEILRRVRERLA